MTTPLDLCLDRARESASRLAEPLRLDGPRLLAVEDDADLEPLVRRAVEGLDPPVALDWCRSTVQAYGYLAREYYDLVLVDYLLEGSRAGLTLRSTCWELQPQAIFAMTSSYPLNDYLHSVGRAGTPFLPKPFGARQLRRFIGGLLQQEDGWPQQEIGS